MVRLVSGVTIAVVFVALIWFLTPVAMLGVTMVVAALAFIEYGRIVTSIGVRMPWWTALAATLGTVAMVPYPWVTVEVVLALGLVATVVNVLLSDREGAPLLSDTAAAMLAPVYLGLPLGCLVAIDAMAGPEAVLVLLGTVAVSDSSQYYVGRAFGRTPLAPRHSPKKTREGALGGFVIAPVFLVLVGAQWLPPMPPVRLFAIGVLVVLAGIIGDLFESILKRAANMKDSSALIPGHGGVLDRIDAVLFASPIFYFFLRSL